MLLSRSVGVCTNSLSLPWNNLHSEYYQNVYVKNRNGQCPPSTPSPRPSGRPAPRHPCGAGPDVRLPGLLAAKKLCACLYEGGVGLKLPAASAERLLRGDPRIVPFQPFGRPPMRAWVHINLPDPEGYRAYRSAVPVDFRE